MAEKEILNEIIRILRDSFQFDPIDDRKNMDNLNLFGNEIALTSMDYVRFVICVETEFNIKWPDEYLYLEEITVGEIIGMIAEELQNSKEKIN